MVKIKKIDIDDSLLNNIGIYTLYDLYRSKVYGIARNGHSYIDTLRRESYEANGQKLKVIESKIDSYEKLSIKEKKAVQDTYSEAHVLFSHDEYLDFNKSLVLKYGEIKKRYSYEETEYMLHTLANDEESDKYSKMVDIDFYEMVETDVDIESYRDYKIDTILE